MVGHVSWFDVIPAAAAIIGALVGAFAVLRAGETANAHQVAREHAAAARDFAWRKQADMQPTLDAVIRATRQANAACVNPDRHVSDDDLANLDATIDRLETSELTREIAAAATEMRIKLVQFEPAERQLKQLVESMPRSGEPLRPDIGAQIVAASERTEQLKDQVLAAVHDTREAVKRMTARFEREQRGDNVRT